MIVPYRILILCTGNAARSLLAESILNHDGRGRVTACSAGSKPKGVPHPVALEVLRARGHDVGGLSSKSWHVYGGPAAPRFDLVITVCDSAAGESCPYWPGAPLTAHWGIPDPASVTGTEVERRAAFELAYRRLEQRSTAFLALPFETLNTPELRARLADIGRLEGATDLSRKA